MDCEDLVRLAAGGDIKAFVALMRRFQQAAFGSALALVHDFGRAEDVESRPAGLHLRPLAERCMSLSTHTAPIRQTRRHLQSANVRTKTGSAWQFYP
jgi:hypothetical protein